MQERSYKASARAFLDLQIKNLVLPPDDQDLPADMVQSRYQRIVKSRNDEFVVGMKRELVIAPISGFYIQQIIFDAKETQALGLLTVDEVIERASREYYIHIKSEEYGIFDPDTAFQAEYDYFNFNSARLQELEQKNSGKSVRLGEWEDYIYSFLSSTGGEEIPPVNYW